MEIDEELLGQVEATDWKMAEVIREDCQCFAERLLQCAEKPNVLSLGEWIRVKELIEKRRDNIKNVVYSLLCRFITRRLNEDLED